MQVKLSASPGQGECSILSQLHLHWLVSYVVIKFFRFVGFPGVHDNQKIFELALYYYIYATLSNRT